MKYCESCEVKVAQRRDHCQFCGGPITSAVEDPPENYRSLEPNSETEARNLSREEKAFRKVSHQALAESEKRTHHCRDLVASLRKKLFSSGDAPFSSAAEMCRWIRETFEVQGAGTVYSYFAASPTGERRQGGRFRGLNFTEDGWAATLPVAEGGTLDQLRVASETVAREIYETVRPDAMQKAHATSHILTGGLPLIAPFCWSVDLLHPQKGLSIRKNFDWIPSSLVAHIDRKAKQILTENWGVNFRKRARPGPISAVAKSFLERSEGENRWEILKEWNRQFTENQYLHPNSLYRHLYRR